MSKEGFPFGKKGVGGELDPNLMSNPDAQEEANMLRVVMQQSPYDGLIERFAKDTRFWDGFRKTTPEDYDNALRELEQLKQEAETQGDLEKFKNKVGRVMESIDHFIGVAWLTGPLGRQVVRGQHEEKRKILEDATYFLNELKKAAKDFGKTQTKIEKRKNSR